LKIRQPLLKMMVAVDHDHHEALVKIQDVILEELNIKEMIILTDDSGMVNKSAKPNFKSIGPKHGKIVNPVANAIRALDAEAVRQLDTGNTVVVSVNGTQIEITPEDVEILRTEIQGWIVQSEEGTTVALDLELNDELLSEGIAREFVNRVQNQRKDNGYEVTDRIEIFSTGPERFNLAVQKHSDYICNETLATGLSELPQTGGAIESVIDDMNVYFNIKKI
jgi:isoleucyl-tRNA synthetase